MTCFSILGMAQFWTNGPASYITLRFLISIFQGGFVPDAILYLSYFYTKSELPVRLALFWSQNSLASIFTGLTSSGLIEMRGVAGKA
jgi:MFS family permease